MKSRLLVLLASALVLGSGTRVEAASQSDGFGVSLTISTAPPPTVTISADDLNFGTAAGGIIRASSLIRVTAPNGLPYIIYLDAGQHLQQQLAPAETRALASGNNLIPYSLATTPFGGSFWGDGVHAGLGTGVTGAGTGVQQNFTVYGEARTAHSEFPDPPDGTYTDFVTATVNF